MYRGSYGATWLAVTGSDSSIVIPTATGLIATLQVENATSVLVASFPNMHFEVVNLERISGSIFSGVNTLNEYFHGYRCFSYVLCFRPE